MEKPASMTRQGSSPIAASLLRQTACMCANCRLPSAATLVTTCQHTDSCQLTEIFHSRHYTPP